MHSPTPASAPFSRYQLILASTSPYRRLLLARLGVVFRVEDPGLDEIVTAEEAASSAVCRLAHAKASAVAKRHLDAFVIGSDQMLTLGNKLVSKPGNLENAIEQLAAASGKTVRFHTGLCVMAPDGRHLTSDTTTDVTFRTLTEHEIVHYLNIEKPFDCAGSFKVEGLGIALLHRISSHDPTALIGLPLIAVVEHLRDLDLNILDFLPKRGKKRTKRQ